MQAFIDKVGIMCYLNLGSVLNISKILLDFFHFAKNLNNIFKITLKRMGQYKKIMCYA